LQGVFFHGEVAYVALLWYATNLSNKLDSMLQAGLSGIRFLDEPARQALKQELDSLPDVQNAVGPAYALRCGVYRDFDAGVTWRKPAGWPSLRLYVGPAARKRNQDSSLYFEDPESGIYGLLITENLAESPDNPAYHKAASRMLLSLGQPL